MNRHKQLTRKEIRGVPKSLQLCLGNRWPHAYAIFSIRQFYSRAFSLSLKGLDDEKSTTSAAGTLEGFE
jgi:hypothetical protein